MDEIAQGKVPDPVLLEFWVKCDDSLKKVEAQLGRDGFLAPLYYSLDLISENEYEQWTAGRGYTQLRQPRHVGGLFRGSREENG